MCVASSCVVSPSMGSASRVRAERSRVPLVVMATLLATASAPAQSPSAQQQRWSVRMAESVMRRHPIVHEEWVYTAGLILLALDRVADKTGDSRYRDYVRRN